MQVERRREVKMRVMVAGLGFGFEERELALKGSRAAAAALG